MSVERTARKLFFVERWIIDCLGGFGLLFLQAVTHLKSLGCYALDIWGNLSVNRLWWSERGTIPYYRILSPMFWPIELSPHQVRAIFLETEMALILSIIRVFIGKSILFGLNFKLIRFFSVMRPNNGARPNRLHGFDLAATGNFTAGVSSDGPVTASRSAWTLGVLAPLNFNTCRLMGVGV